MLASQTAAETLFGPEEASTSSQLSLKGEFTSLEGVKYIGCAQDPAISVGRQGIYSLLAFYTMGLSSPCWREMLLSHTVTGKAEFLLGGQTPLSQSQGLPHGARGESRQNRGVRGSRRTLALDTKMGKERTGSACPGPRRMTHVGTVVSGGDVDPGVQSPGFSFQERI